LKLCLGLAWKPGDNQAGCTDCRVASTEKTEQLKAEIINLVNQYINNNPEQNFDIFRVSQTDKIIAEYMVPMLGKVEVILTSVHELDNIDEKSSYVWYYRNTTR